MLTLQTIYKKRILGECSTKNNYVNCLHQSLDKDHPDISKAGAAITKTLYHNDKPFIGTSFPGKITINNGIENFNNFSVNLEGVENVIRKDNEIRFTIPADKGRFKFVFREESGYLLHPIYVARDANILLDVDLFGITTSYSQLLAFLNQMVEKLSDFDVEIIDSKTIEIPSGAFKGIYKLDIKKYDEVRKYDLGEVYYESDHCRQRCSFSFN
jgi:hypothetical protein